MHFSPLYGKMIEDGFTDCAFSSIIGKGHSGVVCLAAME